MSADTMTTRYELPPEVEDERVRALEQLHMMDTPQEERFARITRMARCVFGVPMASVNLIDRDRQWFKQADGLELGSGTHRRDSVCTATIARAYRQPGDPALIIEDTAESEFAALPGVGVDGIRFYAGYPLYGPGGHAVGTFCVFDTAPRRLTPADVDTLRELAAWAQRELESADDLERASAVQRQLLPRTLDDLEGYRVCALCLPAYAVGGDFYDHYRVAGGAVFTVADVMGKGLGAAILAASVRSALRAATRAVDAAACRVDLAATVRTVAVELEDELAGTDTFVTLFHARLDAETGAVEYVDAGHGFAAIVRRDGGIVPLTGGGLPLGVSRDEQWVPKHVTLEPGDTLAVASDGVLDLVGDGSDIRPLLHLLAQNAEPDRLCAEARTLHARRPPMDDVTVVAVRREVT